MTKIDIRQTSEGRAASRVKHATAAGVVIAVSFMAVATMATSFGGAAADDASTEKVLDTKTISLAGRWSGPHYGYGRVGEAKDCLGQACSLTYDIVACKEGWCGIAVKDDKSCGAVGMHLAVDDDNEKGDMAFKGKLELAKGAAPYTVEAWYRLDEGKQSLHFLGDTGPELLLMRRSFPFEADLARAGEATCTLDKATS